MKVIEPKEYIAPAIKYVEVMVEKGFLISGVITEDLEEDEEDLWD